MFLNADLKEKILQNYYRLKIYIYLHVYMNCSLLVSDFIFDVIINLKHFEILMQIKQWVLISQIFIYINIHIHICYFCFIIINVSKKILDLKHIYDKIIINFNKIHCINNSKLFLLMSNIKLLFLSNNN